MKSLFRPRLAGIALLFVAGTALLGSAVLSATITESELKAKIEANTKCLKDLSLTANVVEVDKRALEKTDSDYARAMELKSAKISLKTPDKMRIEGKLGMVRFEYIISGTTKITRAPAIRIKQKENYADNPARLQGPFDIGLVTPLLWRDRKVEVVDDADAAKNCEIKLRLRFARGDMVYYAWLDAQNLWLKRIEKRDSKGALKSATKYSNPKNIGDQVWMPTVAELYSPEGTRVGRTEMIDFKYNSGLQDSLFQ